MFVTDTIGESSNGRTPGSGPGNWGSNPCSPAQHMNAPVAQLDRALRYGRRGWGFESSRVYNLFIIKHILWPVRLVVRTPPSQGGNRGSTPLLATMEYTLNIILSDINIPFFVFC